MATMRGRGRGGGGGGGGPRGGADGGSPRRRSWRGGPPGSNGSFQPNRGGSPGVGNPAPSPRTSINDHMNEVRKVEDKPRNGGKGLQTDTDISASTNSAPRELQPWVSDGPSDGLPQSNGTTNGSGRDTETFGTATANIPWDQFETNERLFGTRTSYQEELYTTKLNRSAVDYKKREKEAEKLAGEIVNKPAANSHLAEERNQMVEDWSKDEEEKFSGVARNPNAYVPPGARRGPVVGNTAARPTPSPSSTMTPAVPKTNGTPSTPVTTATPLALPPASVDPAAADSARRTSEVVPPAEKPIPDVKSTMSPQPQAVAMTTTASVTESKDGQLSTVVDSFRQFVGTEREKVEAKKQSMAKSERDKQLAEFRKFHTNFKVPLPIPKDMLPILSKDQEKQKVIEQKAAVALELSKAQKAEASKSPATVNVPKLETPRAVGGKKMFMKIPEIPPFNATKRKPEPIPVPPTASQNIPLAVSPVPSAASQASGSQAAAAKLNPNANAFLFEPDTSSVALKPGQSLTGSPAAAPPQIAPPSAAGPSAAPKNPFFRDQVPKRPEGINTRDDFNPWKHGQVPSASSISPQWPYTGRKYHTTFGAPPMHVMGMGGFDDNSSSPHAGPPPLMQGMPSNYPPYPYRFGQPGMPPQQMPGQMHSSPMFSPGQGHASLPGQSMQSPQYMAATPQQPNGMPMYYQNGMPHNPQFLPPHHMQYNPNSPQRQGPGPSPGGPMYYQHQVSTPQQTPQMHYNVPQPPGQGHFQQGLQAQGPGGGYDGGGQH